MNSEEKIKFHKQLLDNLHELYKTKNSDYGDSVHDTYIKYGLTSYLVRIEDKINRARTLYQRGNQKVLDEKMTDTLLDAANYLILAVIDLENDKRNQEFLNKRNQEFLTYIEESYKEEN